MPDLRRNLCRGLFVALVCVPARARGQDSPAGPLHDVHALYEKAYSLATAPTPPSAAVRTCARRKLDP